MPLATLRELPVISEGLQEGELEKRLKRVLKILMDFEDDEFPEPLSTLATALLKPTCYQHKSKTIRILTLCSIAEAYRISFPNPPYSFEEQQIILPMFISYLQVLEDPGSPSFVYGCTLLETLSAVNVFSLDAGTDILSDLFKSFFAIVRPEHSTKIRQCMIQVMSSVVQEVNCVSQELMDIILINILEPAKSETPCSYELAADFIRAASSYLEPYIQMFFNNTLVIGVQSESEVADNIYDLILELHSIDPTLLLSVLSQLEYKLKSTDSDERLKVTQLLAKMFAMKGSKLALEHKTLWFCFLGRFSDASSDVRTECVRHSKYYLAYHPELAADVSAKLHERFHDPEESVRLEVVHAVCEAAADSLEAVPKMLMDDLQERMRDKKWAVRREAMTNLSRLYRQVICRTGVQVIEMEKVDWIASKIFHSYYQSSLSDRLCVERCVLSCLVPATLDANERMDRLIKMYLCLDEYAARAFGEMLRSQFQTAVTLKSFISYQKEENANQFEEMKNSLSCFISDHSNAMESLDNIFEACCDKKIKEEVLQALSTDVSCRQVIQSKANALKMMEKMKGTSDVMKVLLDHCCSILLDAESVQILVETICGMLHDLNDCTHDEDKTILQRVQLLKIVSEVAPAYFSKLETTMQIVGFLRSKKEQICKDFLQILFTIGHHIHSSASGSLHPLLSQMILKGISGLTKKATKCYIRVFASSSSMIERLFTSVTAKERLAFEHGYLLNTLIAVGQFARLQPAMFASCYKQVVRDFIVKELLVNDRSKEHFREGDPEWTDESSVSFETQAKVLGIKVLVLWLLGIDQNHKKLAVPVLRLLETVLAHDGDLQGEDNISASDRSRLRLSAATGMLKLARNPLLADIISVQQFQRLSLVAQDTCKEVREGFIHKLHCGLKSMELPMSYISILSLLGAESNTKTKAQHQQMLAQHIEIRRKYFKHSHREHSCPEYILCDVVYLLAHHPCMESVDETSNLAIQECLNFFMDPLLHGGDPGLAGLLLANIKKTVDAQDPENTETCTKMHSIADMAIKEISAKGEKKNLDIVTQRVALPVRLFLKHSKRKADGNAGTVQENEKCVLSVPEGAKRNKVLKEKN